MSRVRKTSDAQITLTKTGINNHPATPQVEASPVRKGYLMALAGKVEVSIGLPRRELTMLETALRRELAVTLMYGNGVSNMTVDQMRELIERTISLRASCDDGRDRKHERVRK